MPTLSLPQFDSPSIPVHPTDITVDPREAESIIGKFSSTSKMPCNSYSIDARRCNVGSRLRNVAGSTCESCYACKGSYNWPNTLNAMERRYRALFDSRWTVAFAVALRVKGNAYFRWHDSGDLQSVTHLRNIVNVAILTPKVSHWLPTREYGIVREYLRTYGEFPSNLTVRVSAPMVDGSITGFDQTSEVGDSEEWMNSRVSEGAIVCDSREKDGKCLDCRACWDKNVPTVIYPIH